MHRDRHLGAQSPNNNIPPQAYDTSLGKPVFPGAVFLVCVFVLAVYAVIPGTLRALVAFCREVVR